LAATRIISHQPPRHGILVEIGFDQRRGEVRLVIAEPYQQKRVIGELPLQLVDEYLRRQAMSAQDYADFLTRASIA
jgi:hypothetical protein